MEILAQPKHAEQQALIMHNTFKLYLGGMGTTSTDSEELSFFVNQLLGPGGAGVHVSSVLGTDLSNVACLLEYLPQLDLTLNTLAWLSALITSGRAILNSQEKEEEETSVPLVLLGTFFSRTHDLAQKGNPLHIRAGFHYFSELCRIATALAERAGSNEARTSVLRSFSLALSRVSPNQHVLTPVHGELMSLAMRSGRSVCEEACKAYAEHRQYLAYAGRCCPVCAEGYVRFYYCAGRIEAALGRYPEAARLLRSAVAAPQEVCSGSSGDQVRAYGLLVVVTLISTGTFDCTQLPPLGTGPEVAQHISATCKAYTKLGQAFSRGDACALAECIAAERETWHRDETEELVGKLELFLTRHKIARCARVYATATLGDVARHAGLRDEATAARALADAIKAGVVSAEVDESKGIVKFEQEKKKPDKKGDCAGIADLATLSNAAIKALHATIIRDFDSTKTFRGHESFEDTYGSNDKKVAEERQSDLGFSSAIKVLLV